MKGKYINIDFLSRLLKFKTYKWYVQSVDKEKGVVRTEINPNKGLMLSWYGPSVYIAIGRKYKYYYMLSDENEVSTLFGVGNGVDYPKIPRSFPIIVRYIKE